MSLDELPADVRESTLAALRLRRPKLVRDLTDGLSTEPGREHINRADLAGILVLIRAVHHGERTVLGELSLEEGIGASVDSWQIAARAISGAAVEISGIVAENHAAVAALRDPLTTLLSPVLFDFVLAQEVITAHRHGHGISMLTEHTTDATAPVTLSAAAVGTGLVDTDLDHRTILSEAEAAVVRARMNGGDRTERVALLPTSVTIPGAASLLGLSNREVSRLLRGGALRATRRGRHLHIERAAIDAYRHRS